MPVAPVQALAWTEGIVLPSLPPSVHGNSGRAAMRDAAGRNCARMSMQCAGTATPGLLPREHRRRCRLRPVSAPGPVPSTRATTGWRKARRYAHAPAFQFSQRDNSYYVKYWRVLGDRWNPRDLPPAGRSTTARRLSAADRGEHEAVSPAQLAKAPPTCIAMALAKLEPAGSSIGMPIRATGAASG